jgi:phage tail P2-like protein
MWKTIDIVPSSIRDDPQVQAACYAIDNQLADLYGGIPSVAFWPNIYTQVPPLLDVMMWEYHVDINQMVTDGSALTDDKKRELIDASIVWHQKKGTKWAVEQALQSVWGSAYVTEWYQYGGKPFFFRVIIDQDVTDATIRQRVYDTIQETKNVRSWLEGFLRPITFQTTEVYAGATLVRRKQIQMPSYTNQNS